MLRESAKQRELERVLGGCSDVDADMREAALRLGALAISRHGDRALVRRVIARAKAQGRHEAP